MAFRRLVRFRAASSSTSATGIRTSVNNRVIIGDVVVRGTGIEIRRGGV
jgi:hypothetical protein